MTLRTHGEMERYSAKALSKSLNQIVHLPTAHVDNTLSNRVFTCLYFRPFKTKKDFLFRRFNVKEKLNTARTHSASPPGKIFLNALLFRKHKRKKLFRNRLRFFIFARSPVIFDPKRRFLNKSLNPTNRLTPSEDKLLSFN